MGVKAEVVDNRGHGRASSGVRADGTCSTMTEKG